MGDTPWSYFSHLTAPFPLWKWEKVQEEERERDLSACLPPTYKNVSSHVADVSKMELRLRKASRSRCSATNVHTSPPRYICLFPSTFLLFGSPFSPSHCACHPQCCFFSLSLICLRCPLEQIFSPVRCGRTSPRAVRAQGKVGFWKVNLSPLSVRGRCILKRA